MVKMLFRELCGKPIVGNMGGVLGKVTDVVFDENTGKIISLDVEPSENSPIKVQDDSYVFISFKIVLGVKDVVVVDESKLDSIKIISKEKVGE